MAQGLTTLVEIDFLPAGYRQRSLNRRASIWRAVAALSIVTSFLVAAQWQRTHHAQICSELAAIDVQYAAAMAKNVKFAEMNDTLRAEQKSAEFLTFLRHRWPRTQIMAAIVDSLPDSVVLTDWQISQETIALTAPPAIAVPEANAVPPDKPGKRAGDLKHLLQESSTRRHFVFLAGHADEAAALHAYLAQIGTNALFERVDLVSLEHVTVDKGKGSSLGTIHFTARAILKPGHGQLVSPPAAPPGTAASGTLAHRGESP